MAYADNNILEAITQGRDDKVLKVLYQEELPKVKHYVLNNSGNEEEAEDIFQDAVLILYKQVRRNKFDPKHEVGAFLFSVARNLWINKAKRDKRQIRLDEGYQAHVEDEAHFMDEMISQERERTINDILDRIGKKCKQLLIYSVFEKMSMKEICERMGFSTENAAKTRNYKCKQKLIELVKDNPEIEHMLRG